MTIDNVSFPLGEAGVSRLGGTRSWCSYLCQGHLSGGRASMLRLRGNCCEINLEKPQNKAPEESTRSLLGGKPGERQSLGVVSEEA